MSDKADFLELFHGRARRDAKAVGPVTDAVPESEDGQCPAFGYLRGLDARALAVEFRFRDGNSDWYSYNLLASWRYNPSVGLLLKFTSDVTTLVLIRGSNLDALIGDKAINLTDRGFQRHRILWVREMDEAALGGGIDRVPSVASIEVVEFEQAEGMSDWLHAKAPEFVRG
jgi:hypothetical protein